MKIDKENNILHIDLNPLKPFPVCGHNTDKHDLYVFLDKAMPYMANDVENVSNSDWEIFIVNLIAASFLVKGVEDLNISIPIDDFRNRKEELLAAIIKKSLLAPDSWFEKSDVPSPKDSNKVYN